MAVLTCVIVFVALVFVRIELVSREHQRVLNHVSELAKEDIKQHKDWIWRYDTFREVNLNEMVFKFWKPVKSFYKDHRCLKEQRS